MISENKFDIIVIGAGAAGLMAAGQAATQGAKVLLLEKMLRPARKLRITGKGRCNITNTADMRAFINHFGPQGKFLYQAFHQFFSDELVNFFEGLGVHTASERGGRIFPASNKAQDVVDALVKWSQRQGVRLLTQCRVESLQISDNQIQWINADDHGKPVQLKAKNYILTTGGLSYPATGSTGDGYMMAESAGHQLIPIVPALVPVETVEKIPAEMSGLILKNVQLSFWQNANKIGDAFGEMSFMNFGLSGPVILTNSKMIGEYIRNNQPVTIKVDLKPALDHKKLDNRLLRDIETKGSAPVRVLLEGLLPLQMINYCAKQTGLSLQKKCAEITADERKTLRLWLKENTFTISAIRPIDEALVTSGGIDLKEIDPNTMQSRIVSNLYFAGEILDLDGDTGGYNLQAAFSTGWLAGRSASLLATDERR